MPNFVSTCLVVEDSIVDRMMMGQTMEPFRKTVKIEYATSLAEARNCLTKSLPSFIFLDNSLPDGTGADFVLELGTHPNWRQIPVVLVTDWPSPFMYAKVNSSNVIAVWSKNEFKTDLVSQTFSRHLHPRSIRPSRMVQ